MKIEKRYCCICGNELTGFGNNPEPYLTNNTVWSESKNHLPGYGLRAGGSPEREYDKYMDIVTEQDAKR